MQPLRLEIVEDKEGFLDLLKDRIKDLDYDIVFYKNTSAIIFKFDDETVYKEFLKILSETIVEIIELNILTKVVNENCFYFDENERIRIINDAKDILNGNKSIASSIDVNKKRIEYIYGRLCEYCKKNNRLILDGFIRFRLKEVLNQLEDSVEKAADDFLIEKEYNEFIKLLRYFVEIQEPKLDEVHVILDSVNNRYVMLDSNLKAINNDLLKDLAKEISNSDISGDDLLISSLITIAPNKIIIHGDSKDNNKELLDTIKSVFYGKVDINEEDSNYLYSLIEKKK